MTTVPPTEIYQLARGAGWTPDNAVTATAISIAENRGSDPSAVSPPNRNGTVDAGLWQINQQHWSLFGGLQALLQPARNALAAFQLWRDAGDFTPWSTFNDGSYRAYLPEARAAAQAAESGPIPPLPGDTSGAPAPALITGVPIATLARTVSDQLGAAAQQGQEAATSSASSVPGAIQNAAKGIGSLSSSVGGFFALVAKVIGDLADSRFWWRILLVAAGVGIIVLGLVLYIRPPIGELAKAAAIG